jgi:hypothetical protein
MLTEPIMFLDIARPQSVALPLSRTRPVASPRLRTRIRTGPGIALSLPFSKGE